MTDRRATAADLRAATASEKNAEVKAKVRIHVTAYALRMAELTESFNTAVERAIENIGSSRRAAKPYDAFLRRRDAERELDRVRDIGHEIAMLVRWTRMAINDDLRDVRFDTEADRQWFDDALANSESIRDRVQTQFERAYREVYHGTALLYGNSQFSAAAAIADEPLQPSGVWLPYQKKRWAEEWNVRSYRDLGPKDTKAFKEYLENDKSDISPAVREAAAAKLSREKGIEVSAAAVVHAGPLFESPTA